MHIVIYRWKLKPDRVDVFREGWRQMTESIYRARGSLGSRLFRASDGTWVAIAQWPDEQTWRLSRSLGSANEEAAKAMQDGVEERLSEEHLDLVDDLGQRVVFDASGQSGGAMR